MKTEQLSKPFDYGRESEVFDLGDEKILKLYSVGFPKEKIVREFENVETISQALGSLVPKAYTLKTVGERQGIIFEKINGVSYMSIFQANPVLYFSSARLIAPIARDINSKEIKGIPTQEQIFSSLIQNSDRLNREEKAILLKLLKKPKTMMLCHGDFHHGNVMRTANGEIKVIDWMDAFIGDPALDVALTAVNALISDAPDHVPYFFRVMYEFLKKTVKLDNRYIKQFPEFSVQRINEMVLLAAGIHLARKEGDYSGHRKYFDSVYKNFKQS